MKNSTLYIGLTATEMIDKLGLSFEACRDGYIWVVTPEGKRLANGYEKNLYNQRLDELDLLSNK